MSYKVLVVDDEEPIADILKYNLENEGYEVVVAYNGRDAVELAGSEDPDIILLDIMLPEMDGMEVCREIRKEHHMPIIMLTAKDSEIDKVLGLELGADDYVTKPFSNREVVARVKANLRRMTASEQSQNSSSTPNIKVGALEINRENYSVTRNGELVDLTHREFELLLYLAKHLEQVMTREHLLETVWGYDYYGDVRTVDVTIRRLREKLRKTQVTLTGL